MHALQSRLPYCAFTQQDNPRNYVIVVDDLAVFSMNRAGKLTEANFWTLRNGGDVFDSNRSAALGSDHGFLNIVDTIHKPYFADVDLLQAFLNEASASIGIVIRELLLDLGKTQAVRDQLVRVEANLVLPGRATEAGHVNYVGDGFQALLDGPVLDRFQIHSVIRGIRAMQREEINLANGAPVGAHLRYNPGGQRNLAQTLENAFAIPVVVRVVVKDHFYIGKPEQRERTEMNHVGHSVHGDFERDGDLLFDLFRRNPRPLRDDFDIVVGDIGISFNRQVMERDDSGRKDQNRKTQNKQAIVEREIDDPAYHLLLHRVLQIKRIGDHLISRLDARNNFLLLVRQGIAGDDFDAFEMPIA